MLHYLAIREQFCTMLFSMEIPCVALDSTILPSWYHSTCMSSSTKEAMHWKGRLSPWKTIWCWEGVIWKEGSSRGASKETTGKSEKLGVFAVEIRPVFRPVPLCSPFFLFYNSYFVFHSHLRWVYLFPTTNQVFSTNTDLFLQTEYS